MTIFADFDVANFWKAADYALKEYIDAPPSADLVASLEEELGYRLPRAYIELMQHQNGGIPHKCLSPHRRENVVVGGSHRHHRHLLNRSS